MAGGRGSGSRRLLPRPQHRECYQGCDYVTPNWRESRELLRWPDAEPTEDAINAACVRARKPLVSAAAIRFEAQISVFDARDPASPCYRCLYGAGAEVEETCTANGVIAPLLGVACSVQALEAMKIIMQIGKSLSGRLLLLDVLNMEWHSALLPKDPACPVCGPAT